MGWNKCHTRITLIRVRSIHLAAGGTWSFKYSAVIFRCMFQMNSTIEQCTLYMKGMWKNCIPIRYLPMSDFSISRSYSRAVSIRLPNKLDGMSKPFCTLPLSYVSCLRDILVFFIAPSKTTETEAHYRLPIYLEQISSHTHTCSALFLSL